MGKSLIIVIPNWNGATDLPACVHSVLGQTYRNFDLLVVDNGSTDDSIEVLEKLKITDSRLRTIYRKRNYGFTGGVNPGMTLAIREGFTFVATLNNDAVADKEWASSLIDLFESNASYGIAAPLLLSADRARIDSTGEAYSMWGLPYPVSRGSEASQALYKSAKNIFGASGGASMYRVKMLREVGIFDQDFFAYYEDVDLSFRAQLAGWKVGYVPEAVVYHEQGKTSTKLGGRKAGDRRANPFTTKQYFKNLPYVFIKNVPVSLLPKIAPRFFLAYSFAFAGAVLDGRGLPALKGVLAFWLKLPKKLWQRRKIQRNKKVSDDYIWSIITHDLPPNAHKLRKLRNMVLKFTRTRRKR